VLDHSWVELDRRIVDAAVCFPDIGGYDVGPPVFASIDLTTGKPTKLIYAYDMGSGFDAQASQVFDKSLREFAFMELPDQNIWRMAARLLLSLGLPADSASLEERYGDQKRKV
jgi:hypothetical protein